MKIQEMIVVEGRDDTVAVQRAVEADTIETGGSAINDEKIKRIRLAQHRRGAIIFTDPDYPGERIRKIIDQAVPGCKHAFLTKDQARSHNGKLGIEYASPEDIRAALKDVRWIDPERSGEGMIPFEWLQHYGLIGEPESHHMRMLMGEKLGIGYCNGKQFYKRLQAFLITQEEFLQAYEFARQETQG